MAAHTLESLSGAPAVVAADLDGTLLPLVLDGSQGLTPLTIKTVRMLTDWASPPSSVTGRMFSSAAGFAAQLGLTGPVACLPGRAHPRRRDRAACCTTTRSRSSLSREILEFVEPEHLSVNLYIEDQLVRGEKNGGCGPLRTPVEDEGHRWWDGCSTIWISRPPRWASAARRPALDALQIRLRDTSADVLSR